MEARLNASARAQYHFDHHVTRSWFLQKGRVSYRLENLNQANYLPRHAILGFLDYDELTGTNVLATKMHCPKFGHYLIFPLFGVQATALNRILISVTLTCRN